MRGLVWGRPALFCGPTCREGLREDRRAGLIYGPSCTRGADGRVTVHKHREDWSLASGLCAYCSTPVPTRSRRAA